MLTYGDGNRARVGDHVVSVHHDDRVGTVERIYEQGFDRDNLPHGFDDALVRWPDGEKSYEYLHHLTLHHLARISK